MPELNFPQPAAADKFTRFQNRDLSVEASEAANIAAKYITTPVVAPVAAPEIPVEEKPLQPSVEEVLRQFREKEGVTDPVEDPTQAATKPLEPEAAPEKIAEPTPNADFGYLANFLVEKGLVSVDDVPEGVDPENLNQDSFWDLVDYNVKRKEEAILAQSVDMGVKRIAAQLSETSIEVLNFQLENPNVTDPEVRAFMESILYADSITQLDATDVQDAASIVQQWMLTIGESQADIDSEIESLRATGRLEAKAQAYKPKLLQRMKAEKDSKDQVRLQIQQRDEANHRALMVKVQEMVTKGKINGVAMTRDEQTDILGIIGTNNIPVPVAGGRTMELGYLEYLVAKNRTEEGGVERLALAALILKGGPQVIEKYFRGPAKAEEIKKFTTQVAGGHFKSTGSVGNPQPKVDKIEKSQRFFSRSLA